MRSSLICIEKPPPSGQQSVSRAKRMGLRNGRRVWRQRRQGPCAALPADLSRARQAIAPHRPTTAPPPCPPCLGAPVPPCPRAPRASLPRGVSVQSAHSRPYRLADTQDGLAHTGRATKKSPQIILDRSRTFWYPTGMNHDGWLIRDAVVELGVSEAEARRVLAQMRARQGKARQGGARPGGEPGPGPGPGPGGATACAGADESDRQS